jgi:sterol desaturase/sphingolipid hydroxylase (fatty acid hydroxylase superfamily)
MWEASRDFLGGWLRPDPWTLFIIGYWAIFAAIAWLETVVPAFCDSPDREQRWPTNVALGIINMLMLPLIPVSALLGATWAQSNDWGLLNFFSVPLWAAVVATLVLRSLVEYVFHVLMHKTPWLWRLHRIHHSDARLDVSTAVRDHPLEIAALVITLGLSAAAFGMNVWAVIVYEVAESVISLASHANLRLPDRLDRALRWVIVTPNMHCLHHSSYQPETDSNYGQVFSIWDRLFGTYSAAPRESYDSIQFGLEEIQDARAADFWWQLRSPIYRSLRR